MQIHTTSSRCHIPFVLLLTSLFSISSVFAQGSGTLQGRVVDNKTGETLGGANILVQKTTLGTAADMDGRFAIHGIPAGKWSIRVSLIGYLGMVREIVMTADSTLIMVFQLEAQTIEGKEVVVTAQAKGQEAAISEQLSAQNIVNVVSSARIQELPDANAAESIGRLPGVSLLRSGGEANQVVIRGLEPKYNIININGVEIPATSNGDRGTNLSMVSSNLLEGIELSKTVMPDMDAAVLGGTVNFRIKEAKGTSSGAPAISLLAQGGYNNLGRTYHDFKFVASGEDRFLDGRFGVFAQAITDRKNHISNEFGASYEILDKLSHPNDLLLDNIQLQYVPRDQRRYDGTLVLDYQLPEGKINLTNLGTVGKTSTQTFSQSYDVHNGSNGIYYGASGSDNTIHSVTNILNLEQVLFSVKVNGRVSHSYSDNGSPNGWYATLQQNNAGVSSLNSRLSPEVVAQKAAALTNVDTMILNGVGTWRDFNKQRNTEEAIDLERTVPLSDNFILTLKAGGMHRYTDRYYNHDEGGGQLLGSPTGFARQWIVNDVGLDPTLAASNNLGLSSSLFRDPGVDFGTFLHGDYAFNDKLNLDLLQRVVNSARRFGEGVSSPLTGGVRPYQPNQVGSVNQDYSGFEKRNAGYLMGTLQIGSDLSLIGGVRFQELTTSYTAARFFYNAGLDNQFPLPILHSDTTKVRTHGFWLPDAIMRYSPYPWLNVRLAVTNTITYPDFSALIPRLEIYSNSVTWNNFDLKPARSQNFDAQVSVFENSVGLFSFGGFLKRIDDLIFGSSVFITDPANYPDLPNDVKLKGRQLYTSYNNPNRVDVWGVETEWQTHFWYLPDPFKGLVLNVNYTHIFSEAKYPLVLTRQIVAFPRSTLVYIDSSYADRLMYQPDDIVNVSLGFDYEKFSILGSVIYQSNIFNGTNFYNSLRSDKVKYLRWDISVKQGLPVPGIELFFDLNNINSEDDIYQVRGSGFPTSQSDYGLTADIGIRWRLE